MKTATTPKSAGKRDKRPSRGKVTLKVAVYNEIVKATAPAGSRFEGLEGRAVIAPLPNGMTSHVGSELRPLCSDAVSSGQGQLTVPRLAEQREIGVCMLRVVPAGLQPAGSTRRQVIREPPPLRKRLIPL